MTIRAVLFDVGGPIDTEVVSERLIDRDILAALEAEGVPEGAYEAANAWAIESFAPDTYKAIIWRLSGADAEVARAVERRFRAPDAGPRRLVERGGLELRPGMKELLEGLHARGLLLGLAANQPVRIVAELERHGIHGMFAHREVSGHHGYHKPDVRLFLRACEDMGVEPAETVMVGDRVDNDIVPAKVLGMRTVLLRTGRHVAQQPRSAAEVPDFEVWSVAELEVAIARCLQG